MKAPTRWEQFIWPLITLYWRFQFWIFEWLLARMERVEWLHHYAWPWEIAERLAGHGCMHQVCRQIGEPVYMGWEDYNDGEWNSGPVGYYCDAHMHAAGFCAYCHQFYGGIESFEFGRGLCDECELIAQREQEASDDYERAFDDDEDDIDSGGWMA